MHRHDTSTEVLTQAVVRYAVDRVRLDPPPLDGPRTLTELKAMAGRTITPYDNSFWHTASAAPGSSTSIKLVSLGQ